MAAGNVLCVDDDRNLCQILSEALRSEGYRVRSAFDGDQALESVADDAPDLVLIDLILPRRNGFEVLEAVRALDAPLRDVPVVMLSGCSPSPANRERASSLGVMELLTKPIALEDLLAIVARCIGEGKEDRVAPESGSRAKSAGLSGSLKRVPISALLHHLHGLRATGVLHLTTGRKRKWIELQDGYPRSVRSNLVNECLGNFLVRAGKITKAALEESRRRMKPGRLQGEILVAMDLLSEDEVVASLASQADEKLFEIFAWTSGSYKFEKGRGLERANSLGLVQSPANLIVRGIRARFPQERVDAYLRKHADCFLAHGESPFYRFQDVDLDPDDLELFESLDGRRRLAEFLDGEGSRKQTLYALLAVGLLELRRSAAVRAARDSATSPQPQTAPTSPQPQTAPTSPQPQTAPASPQPHAAPASPQPQTAPASPQPHAAPASPQPQTAPTSPQPHAAPASRQQQTAPASLQRRSVPTFRVEEEEKHARLMALADRLSNQSYFEILGVGEQASSHEVTAAFERLAGSMHPDHYSTSSDSVKGLAGDVFAVINRAHETLSDTRLRGQYVLTQQKEQRRVRKLAEDHAALEAEKCFRMGEALLNQRAYERALQSFGKAIELHPEEGDYHAHYGWTLHLCHPGEPTMAEEALEHIKRGIKLAGHREKSYLFIGRLYKAIGHAGAAEKMFTRAVQIQPECVEALRELRLINMRRHKSKGFIGRLLRR